MNTDYRQFFFDLRGKYLAGIISYDEAKELAKPILEEMNIKGKEIAKKYGKKFIKFTLTGFMR